MGIETARGDPSTASGSWKRGFTPQSSETSGADDMFEARNIDMIDIVSKTFIIFFSLYSCQNIDNVRKLKLTFFASMIFEDMIYFVEKKIISVCIYCAYKVNQKTIILIYSKLKNEIDFE